MRRKSCLQAAQESATGAREEAQAACLKKAATKEVRQFYIRHFGFFSMHKRTPKHNATLDLSDLPAWFYYQHPSNLSCHDLTRHTYAIPPPNFRALLSLGLKFIPRPRYTTSTIIEKSIDRIRKDLFNKCLYAGSNDTYDPYLYAPSSRPPLNTWFPLNSRTGSILLRQVYAVSTERDVHRQTYYHTNGTA